MTLRDAGQEFARLTGGLAPPKVHVELVQCVLNNKLSRLYPLAINAWHSIPDEKRATIPDAMMNRLVDLIAFFEHTAEAARTGETPAMSLQRQNNNLMADTANVLDIVPLQSAEETE